MVERRNFPGIETSLPVLYFAEPPHSPHLAWTPDLSLGGTRIEFSNALTKGNKLWIQIAVEHQTIKCRGEAIYILEPDNGNMKAGVKFEELSEHDRLYLRQYIAYIMEQRD